MSSEWAEDMSYSEVTCMIEKQLHRDLLETGDNFVSNRSGLGLKKFCSTQLFDRCIKNESTTNVVLPLTMDPVKSEVGVESSSPVRRIPIVGYEEVEERARFTAYKMKISSKDLKTFWYVFRRYTDFVRLHSKLKAEFRWCKLTLPRKRWFGNNFDSSFIDNRLLGLQRFIDEVTSDNLLIASSPVREFFCLDQPPSYPVASEENRVIFEALEDTIRDLRLRLAQKEQECESLRSLLSTQQAAMTQITTDTRQRVENCEKSPAIFRDSDFSSD
ncbi:hypothetical protein AAG570_004532 [Ranatra chinensis]|uniref:PX domain-containing protein n=1 Tax=Ranatra chinensis TaxID=642074 RepID=A0ABD0Y3F7_9HEMI